MQTKAVNPTYILIRHAESLANKERLLVADNDSRLTLAGQKQAEALGRFLSTLDIDQIYSSPVERCCSTAQLAGKVHGLKVKVDDRLVERRLGKYEGYPIAQLASFRTDAGHSFHDPTQDWEGVDEVEQDNQIYKRFTDFTGSIRQIGTVAIVTHAGFIKAVLSEILQKPSNAPCIIKIPNCSYSIIERSDDVWLIRAISSLPS